MPPHNLFLLITAFIAIVLLVLLISRWKVHPFVALLLVSIAMGIVAGMPLTSVVRSFELGMGNTLGHIAVVIALGSILGKLMAESGGADRIALTLIRWFGAKRIPWAMLLIGMLVGLPVFFEVGFVLLISIAYTVAKRTRSSIVLVALPMLAGLSVVHALVPPHPAAMAAVAIFNANMGRTIAYALLIGVPSAILAGPLYAKWIAPRLQLKGESSLEHELSDHDVERPMPSFAATLATLLLPVLLMLLGGWTDQLAPVGTRLNGALHLIGNGDIALLFGVLLGSYTFGLAQGMTRADILRFSSESLGPTVGAMLMIGAGGGFGRLLEDTHAAGALMALAAQAHLSLLLTAWLFAAMLRLATGSSTVAMITAAGIVAPVALHTPGARPELLAIATGAGSIIFSHVNDGGFWLVKEYLGLSVPQTFASWSVCETILSVSGLALVLCAAHF